jgi:anti-anti-sigma regulatory factor
MTVHSAVATADGGLIVTLTGELRLEDVASVRLRLMKSLAEQPEAVLIDVNGLRVEDPLSLAVFVAVARQATRWPGIPVLICTDTAETRAQFQGAAYRRLPLFRTIESAQRAATSYERSLPTLSDEIIPIAGAPRHARNVVTDACVRWDLPRLAGPATLIANEFVCNVIAHANTMATLRLALRPRHLAIAVRDGSTAEPIGKTENDRPGRGLLLVEAMAGSWGWLPTEGGKVVWATLLR